MLDRDAAINVTTRDVATPTTPRTPPMNSAQIANAPPMIANAPPPRTAPIVAPAPAPQNAAIVVTRGGLLKF
jgi:hypothetical protein